MRFSPKFRGVSSSRSSPLIFKSNKKSNSSKKAQSAKAPASATEIPAQEPLQHKASTDGLFIKEAQDTFPLVNEHVDEKHQACVDKREEELSDCSIQTERRDEIESMDSIRTEYEPPEETEKHEATCKNDDVESLTEPCFFSHETNQDKTNYSDMEKSLSAVEGYRARLIKGLQSPYLEKSLAAVRECQDSFAKRLNQVPLPVLETSLAKVNQCTGGMKTSLAKANDRAGSVAKEVSHSMERLVCGDERTLQYHAQQQEQIISPKQLTLPVTAEGIKSPTNAALGKYTLHRLLCGNYRCSDCVSDLAIGAADIIFLGYCDCDNSKDIVKTDTIEEFEDVFSYRTDVLSPDTAEMGLLSPTTAEDETTRTFTFDSTDSAEYLLTEEAPKLNLSKAALIAENKMLVNQSVELTEEEFNNTMSELETLTVLPPVIDNSKNRHFHTPFTPKTPQQQRRGSPSKSSPTQVSSSIPVRYNKTQQCEVLPTSANNATTEESAIPDITSTASDNEKIAIELLVTEVLPTETNKPVKKRGRRKFFRRDKEAQTTKAATTGYRFHAIIEDTKKRAEEPMTTGGSSATSCSDKPEISHSVSLSTGEGSAAQRKNKNCATAAGMSLKPGWKETRQSTAPTIIKPKQGVAVNSSDDEDRSGIGSKYGTPLDRGTAGASFQSKESILTAQTSNGGTIDNQPSLYSF